MAQFLETVTVEAKNGGVVGRGVVFEDGVIWIRITLGDMYVSPMAAVYPSLTKLTEAVDKVGGVIRLHVPPATVNAV